MNTYEKMREAAINIVKNEEIFFGEDQTTREEWEKIHSLLNALKSALAKSPRNCEVGTAEEQLLRFRDGWERANGEQAPQVGLHLASQFSRWAQMPYESEVME